MAILIIVLQFFASLSLLVVIHEFGHFLMAKIFKVRVEKFYLFFNPWFTLFKYKPKNSETEYGMGWLPLGGYVKLCGMIDESMDTEHLKKDPEPWEFRSKPAWQRFLIDIMGVVFNFLLALFIYSMISFHYGERFIPFQNITAGMEFSDLGKEAGFQDGDIFLRADTIQLSQPNEAAFRSIMEADKVTVLRDGQEVVIDIPDDFILKIMESKNGFVGYRYPFVVDSVMPESRAQRAGLQSGDSLLTVCDSADVWHDAYVSTCTGLFTTSKNIPLKVNVKRGADTLNLVVTPDCDGHIGVYMKPMASFYEMETVSYGFFESFAVGVKKGFGKLFNYASDMKYVFTKTGAQSLGGFISIGSLFPYPFDAHYFWEMTAFLSVILAFMNILPIPALDGGHLVFILYEMITRRKPSEKVVMKAQMIGMMFLLFLFFYANINDLFRFF